MIITELFPRALPKLTTTSTTTTSSSSSSSSSSSTLSTSTSTSRSGTSTSTSASTSLSSSSSTASTASTTPTISPPSSNDNPFVFHSQNAPREGTVFIATGFTILIILIMLIIWWIISISLRSYNCKTNYNNSHDISSTPPKYIGISKENDNDDFEKTNVNKKSESQSLLMNQSDVSISPSPLFVSPTVAITKIHNDSKNNPFNRLSLIDIDSVESQRQQQVSNRVSLLSPLQSPNNEKYYSFQTQLRLQKPPQIINDRKKIPSMYLEDLLENI
ncbi:similar to Saccharomyces cerevisiae YIL117C PRM5 Pheromone-regulated protein, predicted to have 1 transmembrane segment [Maudiozyma saulgeensis]|uniref:Similar to Saccharomyces cerevisiae YIL117C PRM5 Pheromone-regulated protein, predicted to have 1 transmembrane segment n=1 Tax=Maudiozyma saulgeensis TaxID=1789683 RepID=A0A1X7R4K6_9SACH|nr:similar to Saccharomyces cerevisiae YIL117C PRM5 Pheromone-regulated protein, predicted to have 1 transmembrane segment [Kazachstania saulgeensis]